MTVETRRKTMEAYEAVTEVDEVEITFGAL